MDIAHGCMPNKFSHILFGKLKSLSDHVDPQYRGDRIYIKPEEYGLQQFRHYLARECVTVALFIYLCFQHSDSGHYIRSVSNAFLCEFIDQIFPSLCMPEGAFREWTDRQLIRKWNQILATVDTLTRSERLKMQDQALSHGVLEMHRQTLLFPSIPQVNDFRAELKRRYAHDVSSRKGHEIIYTTEQLLTSLSAYDRSVCDANQQCDTIVCE